MIYLTYSELIHVAERTFGEVLVRDEGLQALVDGNKRLALAASLAFLGVNGRRLTLSNDDAYGLIVSVAAGEIEDVGKIADQLRRASEDRYRSE